MKVTQVYEIVNTVAKELLGEDAVVNEDLSNVVDIGKNFEDVVGLDNYVKSVNDVIGRKIFVDRIYSGRAPSVLMDGWEFGSIVEKISPEIPEAEETEDWELQDGASYDPNIFYKPSVTVKCWNDRITFQVPVSITERQVKSAFNSVTELNAFLSMIYSAIQNAMTVRLDGLIMRTINNFIGETIYSDYNGVALTSKSGIKAVNLLYDYNHTVNSGGTALTADKALSTPEFIRFASAKMSNYIDRLKVMSNLFNIGSKSRFTPEDRLHVIFLSEFKNSANMYLQSDTFNADYTALPNGETVTYWQGSGTDYSFSSTSKIDIKTSNNHTISVTGVIGFMFDTYALGVTNQNPRVTSQYNAKADFWNEWHKFDAGYFNDTNENGVVFFVA